MRASLFLTASVAALALSTEAYAQQASQAPTDDQSEDSVSIEDVVVTAQKREERLQDVPMTITAVTGAALERSGLGNSRELAQVTPGLVVAQQTVLAQPVLRGVGTRGVGPGDEATVPVYIDGIYNSVQHTGAFDLSNVQRIEVLKGPQGTLFGRNAVGGAISVITKDPSSSFEGNLSASYANFNQRRGELYVSGPLSETLSANLSAYASADDGYIHDDLRGGYVNPSSSVITRAKVRWQPDDLTQLTLSANYAYQRDPSGLSVQPLGGVTAGRASGVAGDYHTQLDNRPYARFHTEGLSLVGSRAFDGFDLTGLASYQYTEQYTNSDSDASAAPLAFLTFAIEDKTYTGELRATSSADGPFRWIVGAYLFNAEACYCYFNSSGTLFLLPTQTSKAYALFGEGTYELTDRLSVTAGLRFSQEDRSIVTLRSDVFYGSGAATFSKLSPRASVTYEFSDQARVYFTYSQGFKSGVFNASSTVLPLTAVEPEILDSYEIGFKAEPSRRIRANLSAFYYDYTNIQVSSRSPITNATVLQNAAAAEIYGGEAQLDMAVTAELNVSAGIAYSHARFTSFPGANILTPRPNLAGNLSTFADVSGNEIPRAPELTASLRADYTVPFAQGELTLSGNVYYSSDYYWDFGNRLKTDAFTAANARISWSSPGDVYRITGYVENLTDDDRLMAQQNTATADYGVRIRPRAFGVKLQRNF